MSPETLQTNPTIFGFTEDLQSWNMTHSRYPDHFGPGGPDVSADLVTTAVDYEQHLGPKAQGRLMCTGFLV